MESEQGTKEVITEPANVPLFFEVRDSVTSFTGRQQQLDEISQRITQTTVIISGLGGVGKSELAVKYAHQHFKKGKSAVWINAETYETAKESFRSLLKTLKIKAVDQDGDEKSLSQMAKNVYKEFSEDSLFIFDNADESSNISEYLPKNGFHVLITSQNRKLFEQKHTLIDLNTLPEDEAVDLVKSSLNVENQLVIKKLVELLGCLPLALQHAVAYIKESGRNIDEYIELFQKSEQEKKDFLNRQGSMKTIYLTFKTAIDKVKQVELAEEILNVIAYFAPENIPKDVFFTSTKVDESKTSNVVSTAIDFLTKYSIVNLSNEQISIHRLVQEVIKLELRNFGDEEKVLMKGLNLLKEFINRENAASRIPHIMSMWNNASNYENLVRSFIVDSSKNKATTSTTYLMLIIEGCSFEIIEAIIQKIDPDKLNAVINAKNKDDLTLLHKAVLRSDDKIVKLLIDVGADVNAKQKNGWTALHFAAKNGNLSIVNALLGKNAEVDVKTKLDFTPLHLAARNGHGEVVEALLAKNANINAETDFKFTPLHLAAENGHLDVIQTLLKFDVLVNVETKDKFVPLHLAAKKGRLSVVKALLGKNADVNVQNKMGFTALHFAVLFGHEDVVKELLQSCGIEVSALTSKGNTALNLAGEKGNLAIMQALADKITNIRVDNGDGHTAADVGSSVAKDYFPLSR